MARKTKLGQGQTIRSYLKANKEMKKAGRKAYANGLTLEKAVEAYAQNVLDTYDNDKPLKAEIYRNHDNMQKARGRGGNLTAFTAGVSSCDFSFFANCNIFEFITAGMIEAKSRNKKSITKSAISHHQRDQLIRTHKLGHIGLILVSLVDDDKKHMYLVPITNWYRGKKKSLNIKDLDAIAYKCKVVQAWNDNQKEFEAPDIIDVLERIDADFALYGDYFPVPPEYAEQFDNKKLKNPLYSTIDEELDSSDSKYDL